MGKSKPQEVSAPQYDFAPAIARMDRPVSFAYPFGTGSMSGGNYTWTESPNQAQKRAVSEKNVNDILATMGTGMAPANDPYTQSFLNELLRESQPRTENALIGRGLGGSTVYREALTDLINKASTQAILNSREQKRQDVSSLENVLGALNSLGMNVGQQALSAKQQDLAAANLLGDYEQAQQNANWQTQLQNLQLQQQAKQNSMGNLTNLAMLGGMLATAPLSNGKSLFGMGMDKVGSAWNSVGKNVFGPSVSASAPLLTYRGGAPSVDKYFGY